MLRSLSALTRPCVLLLCLAAAANLPAANTLVPEGDLRYAPSVHPDRVVLLPGQDPSREVAVAWRTSERASEAVLQITLAVDSPDLADRATSIAAASRPLSTPNGRGMHHHARLTDLQPGTQYAYRVQGAGTWSEWFHFSTAHAGPRPFSFVYLGDTQNSVRSLFSRVVREAWRTAPRASLVLHAGDLVNHRDGAKADDDEWGEWFDAGGPAYAATLAVPAPGNHEYLKENEDTPDERYVLGPHWPLQFPVPANGAAELPHTTWFTDFQGVRFIVLDSTAALEHGLAAAQARWLEPVLAGNPGIWTIVIHHHPMYSPHPTRDNPALREHWLPLFEKYGVDLVLQGHDHTYGRGRNLSDGGNQRSGDGPVFVVSVAGAKQYRLSEDAATNMAPAAENTQLFQVVSIDGATLRYEALTATGRLHDAFELQRLPEGGNRLVEHEQGRILPRRCPHELSPSGRADRCWDGVEW
jgi:hypothetical protein